ncbi:hypothetical protein OHR68_06690 [Spirillospora sp. NBC_00431]
MQADRHGAYVGLVDVTVDYLSGSPSSIRDIGTTDPVQFNC